MPLQGTHVRDRQLDILVGAIELTVFLGAAVALIVATVRSW